MKKEGRTGGHVPIPASKGPSGVLGQNQVSPPLSLHRYAVLASTSVQKGF